MDGHAHERRPSLPRSKTQIASSPARSAVTVEGPLPKDPLELLLVLAPLRDQFGAAVAEALVR